MAGQRPGSRRKRCFERNRDFAPPGMSGNSDFGGDAPSFARFLETELLPSIRARYRTLPFTIIAGHSLSGLFAAYAYGTANGRFFVGAGTAETDLDAAATKLAAEMRANPGRSTAFSHHRLTGDSHYTSPLQGSIDGLRFIFEPVQLSDLPSALVHRESAVVWGNGALLPSSEDELAAYRSLRSRYAEGARTLGLPEVLPPYFGGAHGQWLASSNRVSAAKVICQDVVDSHPENWLGYDCLAQVQRAQKDSSRSAARKAIELAERAGDAAIVGRLRRGLDAVTPKRTPR